MNRTRRVKIVTGLKCNIQCVFCYYRDSLRAPNRSLQEIRSDLQYAWRHDIREVDFSGGEPTIHPDLPAMIAEARRMGMERVCIISNGWRLADKAYMLVLRNAGLDEILFSLHGSREELHDILTATSGSFARITQALSNAAELGISIRTNTVVSKMNAATLHELAHFVLRYHPDQVNFITVNDWCYAKNLVDKLMISYSEMSESLKHVCDILGPKVPAVNVRYIPFCFMGGYERFVCNHRQVPYDRYEWVPRVRARLEIQNTLARFIGIIGYGLIVGGAIRQFGRVPWGELLDSAVTEGLRSRFYVKGSACKKCALNSLCDGVEKTYAQNFGTAELSAVSGDRIYFPMHFRRHADEISADIN